MDDSPPTTSRGKASFRIDTRESQQTDRRRQRDRRCSVRFERDRRCGTDRRPVRNSWECNQLR